MQDQQSGLFDVPSRTPTDRPNPTGMFAQDRMALRSWLIRWLDLQRRMQDAGAAPFFPLEEMPEH